MMWRVLFDAGPARSLRKSDPGFVRPIRAARTGLAEDPASRCKAFPGLLRGCGCSTPGTGACCWTSAAGIGSWSPSPRRNTGAVWATN